MRTDDVAALFAQTAPFAHYEIPLDALTGERRELGRGGMGVTYLARDAKLGRLVVLKVVSQALQADPLTRKRFLREARALAYLHHPCIPVLYELGEAGGEDFYTMEFIEGEDLNKRVKRDGPLPLAEALWVAEQAASALAEAHRVGIVHRDVKPANLMIRPGPAGALPDVRLIDFGLAKDTGGEAQLGISSSGGAGFTPLYASPEQVKSERATPLSDIYSLGVSLWFLLSGNPPFRGTSAYEVEIKHVSVPPPVQTLPESIPPPVRDLLLRLLAKKPSERPASAAGLAQELRDLRTGAAQPGPRREEQDSSLAVGPTLRSSNQPPQPVRTQPENQRTRPAPTTPARWPLLAVCAAVLVAFGLIGLALWPQMPETPARAKLPPPAHTCITLGLPFYAVPGGTLFCAWETRVKDFTAFATARPQPNEAGIEVLVLRGGRAVWEWDPQASWRQPGFTQAPDHPVVGVSWVTARDFCQWLTETERAAGRIPAGASYRLPKVAEWTAATGGSAFPWGDQWPPPAGKGNFLDESAVADFPGRGWPIVKVKDGFARTAPVGSFAPNASGLCDLAGNVWEWCEEVYQAEMNEPAVLTRSSALRAVAGADGKPFRPFRGGSWFTSEEGQLRSRYVDRNASTYRSSSIGFRLMYDPGAPPRP